jgi:sulfite exporter TauE/SafE
MTASLANVAAYNAGRIASYSVAGALAGGATATARNLAGLPALQAGGFWLANLMLVALGLYLMDAWRGLAWLEQGGRGLWRQVQPVLRRVGPPDTPARMVATGFLWGWLPCGMVYSALVTAMLSGSAASGAALMLAFGLGTLPMLAGLGAAGSTLRGLVARRPVRIASGAIVLGFGLLGIARAAGGLPQSWFHTICIGAAA